MDHLTFKDAGLLTREQVAEALEISLPTLRKLVQEGTFPPPMRVHKRRQYWRPEDLDSYILSISGRTPQSA